MARLDVHKLYLELMFSTFAFVPRGTQSLETIYRAVQGQYPQLCDDSYPCSANCNTADASPEWQHVTRNALQALRGLSSIQRGKARGHWTFA